MVKVKIRYEDVKVFDMLYLLSNFDGYMDADRQTLVVDL